MTTPSRSRDQMTKSRKQSDADAGNPSPEGLTFEQAMEKLETIIDQIESGAIGLEDSLEAYAQGVQLVQRCRSILEVAEQKVEALSARALGSGAKGSVPTMPNRSEEEEEKEDDDDDAE